MAPRVWVVSELYYPEETSTGYFLTRIAEGLAERFPVHVLCGQPTYSRRGERGATTEVHRGVHIRRCAGTTLNKDVLPLRALNVLTLAASIFLHAVLGFRRGDRVIVVTNPPTLPFVIRLACALRGARCVLLIHDMYPEVLVATGFARSDGFVVRAVGWATRRLYRSVERVVVLGRDARALVAARLASGGDGGARPLQVIPNWGDVDEIVPAPPEQNRLLVELGLQDAFVVQLSGNMGRTHAIEEVVAAAALLRDDPRVRFLVAGSGAKRRLFDEAVARGELPNVVLAPPVRRDELATLLGACHLSVIAFVPGMVGVSVPSRMYNVMAAGRPLLAVAEPESEFAQVVREEAIGWVIHPPDAEAIAAAIRAAAADPGACAAMGARARAAAVAHYSRQRVVAQWQELVEEWVDDGDARAMRR